MRGASGKCWSQEGSGAFNCADNGGPSLNGMLGLDVLGENPAPRPETDFKRLAFV